MDCRKYIMLPVSLQHPEHRVEPVALLPQRSTTRAWGGVKNGLARRSSRRAPNLSTADPSRKPAGVDAGGGVESRNKNVNCCWSSPIDRRTHIPAPPHRRRRRPSEAPLCGKRRSPRPNRQSAGVRSVPRVRRAPHHPSPLHRNSPSKPLCPAPRWLQRSRLTPA